MGKKTKGKDSKKTLIPSNRLSLILQDVSYLLNRGYDKRRAIDFVASRYLLDQSLRNFIFRTLASTNIANRTKAKLLPVEQLQGHTMGVDGFNILITLQEMLQKNPVYQCYDHVVRDISGNYGRFQNEKAGKEAIQTLVTVLLSLPLDHFTIFLDEPVSHSGKIAGQLRDELVYQIKEYSQGGLSNDVQPTSAVSTVKSPDYELSKFDVVASHDSIVIQKAKHVFDVPQHAMTRGLLSPTVVNIRLLLEGSGVIPDVLKDRFVDFDR